MLKGIEGMKRFGFLVLAIGIFSAELAFAAESLVGKWSTVDEKNGKVTSQVEIYEQSKPKVCIACTGADKNKPIVGLVILRDLSPSGDRYKRGTVLDPEDGKVYTAEIWVEDGKLMVRGYSGFLYRRGLGSRVLETD